MNCYLFLMTLLDQWSNLGLFSTPKCRDLATLNPWISGLKMRAGCQDSGSSRVGCNRDAHGCDIGRRAAMSQARQTGKGRGRCVCRWRNYRHTCLRSAESWHPDLPTASSVHTHTQTTSFCSTHCDRPRRCCHLANNFDSSQIFPILHNGPKIAPSHKEDPGPHHTRDHATSAAIGRFYALRACMRCGLIIFTTQCI